MASLNGLGGSHDRHLGSFTQIAPDGLTAFDPTNDDMQGWASEISLDVEWAHAIAPGANIVLVLAKSDQDADLLSATKYVIDHRLGDIISQSFGEDESCFDPKLAAKEHQLFIEATLKGMTIFASSGDDGAGQSSCDGRTLVKAVSTPAVDPLVTAVGGTELHAASYCLSSVGCDPSTNPAPGTMKARSPGTKQYKAMAPPVADSVCCLADLFSSKAQSSMIIAAYQTSPTMSRPSRSARLSGYSRRSGRFLPFRWHQSRIAPMVRPAGYS